MFQGLPFLKPSSDAVPDVLMVYVSVQGAQSVFGERRAKLHDTSKAFHAKKADRDHVRHNLESSGFTIVAESPLGFGVAAAPRAYEELCGGHASPVLPYIAHLRDLARYVTGFSDDF